MSTVLQDVQNRMRDLTESKERELSEIRQKQDEAQAQRTASKQALKDAIERTDTNAYASAKKAGEAAQDAIDMYAARYDMLSKKEYISEQESDEVINSLLRYEGDLSAEFKSEVGKHLKELSVILEKYKKEVRDTELTISVWCRDIHPNYSTRGATIRTDELTGKTTDRSLTPVPVRTVPYFGCVESESLESYLKQSRALYAG